MTEQKEYSVWECPDCGAREASSAGAQAPMYCTDCRLRTGTSVRMTKL